MALICCEECSKEISEKAKSCPHCGCPNNQIRCPECSKFIISGVEECPHCGYPLKAVKPKVPKAASSPYKAANADSGSGMKGCLAVIGVILIVVCLFITVGNPGAKVFGVSAVIIGMIGMLIIKEFGKG